MADSSCLAVQKYDQHSKKKVSVKLKTPQQTLGIIADDLYHDPEDELEELNQQFIPPKPQNPNHF